VFKIFKALKRFPGDYWEKRRNLRLFLSLWIFIGEKRFNLKGLTLASEII